MGDLMTADMELVRAVEAIYKPRGLRTPGFAGALGYSRQEWYRWRSGVRPIQRAARVLLRLIVDDPDLIWRVMEQQEVGDGR